MAWLFRKKEASLGITQLDQKCLDQLRKAGSDLSQPHEIDNFIYFPDQASAQEAANRLTSSSKEVTASPAAQRRGWVLKAVVVAVPSITNIAQMRGQMESLALTLKGDYDGWGAPIVPRS